MTRLDRVELVEEDRQVIARRRMPSVDRLAPCDHAESQRQDDELNAASDYGDPSTGRDRPLENVVLCGTQ